jgi:lysophospholipase
VAAHDEGFFSAKDNLRLFWETEIPNDPKAHVAVVHGYADHCGRFKGVINALAEEGFGVHAFDYRGHGQADGRRGYVHRWSDYVDDLDSFWKRVKEKSGGKKTFILAHSNGGLIALHWLHQRKPEGGWMESSSPRPISSLRSRRPPSR